MFVSVLFDLGVWYFVKDLKMYDDEPMANAEPKKGSKGTTELTELTASRGGVITTTDADVMMTYKSSHRGSDVCT